MNDVITIVEAAYDVALDKRAWLERLFERVAPKLDRGFGCVAFRYDLRTGCDFTSLVTRNTEERIATAVFAMCNAYPSQWRTTLSYPGIATGTQRFELTEEQALGFGPHVEYLHALGIRDVLGFTILDVRGNGLAFSTPMPGVGRPKGPESAMWTRLAVHIAAGDRLRDRITESAQSDLMEGADAVLSPSGDVEHAEGSAKSAGARESLRAAARAIDRARSKARGHSEEALELWQGLIAGRWSLVDHFDSDGRRYLIARRNDPDLKDPRALSPRERQVLALAALGHSLKVIAYALGLSAATVAEHRARGMKKLGLRSLTELATLFGAQFEATAPRST